MKERLGKMFDDETIAKDIWAGTFHSICLIILRKYGERLGYRQGFSVYDEDDCKRLVCQCMDELSIDEKSLAAKGVIGAISSSKDDRSCEPGFSI